MRVSVNAMGKPSKAKSASQVAKGRKQPRVASVPRSKHSRGAPPLQTMAFGPPGLAHPLDRALQQQQQQADEEEEDLFGGLPGVNSTLRTLVMDVSYTAVDVVSWQRAICLDILEKVEVVEYYESTVKSSNAEFQIPAVIKVNQFLSKRTLPPKKDENINRRSVFLRDDFRCQYCGNQRDLTIDHLIPVSRGGPWTWENLVTACNVCNTKKGSKTPEQAGLKLRSKPFRPSGFRLQLRRSELRSPPAIWEPYLPQDKPRSDLML